MKKALFISLKLVTLTSTLIIKSSFAHVDASVVVCSSLCVRAIPRGLCSNDQSDSNFHYSRSLITVSSSTVDGAWDKLKKACENDGFSIPVIHVGATGSYSRGGHYRSCSEITIATPGNACR